MTPLTFWIESGMWYFPPAVPHKEYPKKQDSFFPAEDPLDWETALVTSKPIAGCLHKTRC